MALVHASLGFCYHLRGETVNSLITDNAENSWVTEIGREWVEGQILQNRYFETQILYLCMGCGSKFSDRIIFY